MDLNEEDSLHRLLYFERERKVAEAIYVQNPRDADNLTRWAGALYELGKAHKYTKSIELMKDAISKLDKALSLNSENHFILWCLGNVYWALADSPCSPAQTYTVDDTSRMYVGRAYGYFKKALDMDPGNTDYQESKQTLEQKFGHYLKEMSHNDKRLEQKFGHYLKEMSDNNKAAKNPKSGNLMYEPYGTLGCVGLAAVGIYALVKIANSRVPPPSPR